LAHDEPVTGACREIPSELRLARRRAVRHRRDPGGCHRLLLECLEVPVGIACLADLPALALVPRASELIALGEKRGQRSHGGLCTVETRIERLRLVCRTVQEVVVLLAALDLEEVHDVPGSARHGDEGQSTPVHGCHLRVHLGVVHRDDLAAVIARVEDP